MAYVLIWRGYYQKPLSARAFCYELEPYSIYCGFVSVSFFAYFTPGRACFVFETAGIHCWIERLALFCVLTASSDGEEFGDVYEITP